MFLNNVCGDYVCACEFLRMVLKVVRFSDHNEWLMFVSVCLKIQRRRGGVGKIKSEKDHNNVIADSK